MSSSFRGAASKFGKPVIVSKSNALRGANDLLYGKHVVSLALALRPAQCEKLILQDGLAESLQEFVHQAEAHPHVQIEFQDKSDMNLLCGSRPHQGVLLQAAPLPIKDLGDEIVPIKLTPGISQVCIVLDEVQDPGNLGGIMRSGFFFGVSGVLTSVKNSSAATSAAAKASAGTSEILSAQGRLFSTHNLMACLDRHKQAGWRILGTAVERGSSSLSDIPAAPLTMLVFGNEGHGLRTNIRNRCDGLVHLPKAKQPPPLIQTSSSIISMPDVSLNVNAAATAILARWQSQVVQGNDW